MLWPFKRKSAKKYNKTIISKTESKPYNHSTTADESNFGLSMAVGMATDSAILGYAAGGSLVGGLVGESMAESFHNSSCTDYSPSVDTSPSTCDSSSSSFDSSSSTDSGSYGGGLDSGSSSSF